MSGSGAPPVPAMVDAHAHVWLKDMPLVSNPRHRLDYDFSIEQYLQIPGEHGVDRAVLAAASSFGDYNDYSIASMRGRANLRGTVILETSVERHTLETMQRDGIVGVRLPYVNLQTLPDLGAFEYRRTLRRIADLDWHVHLHLDGPRIPLVLPTLENAGVKIVIDHFGRPDPALGVNCAGFQAAMRAIERGRAWVKLSGDYRLGAQAAERYGRELLRQVGAERLL